MSARFAYATQELAPAAGCPRWRVYLTDADWAWTVDVCAPEAGSAIWAAVCHPDAFKRTTSARVPSVTPFSARP